MNNVEDPKNLESKIHFHGIHVHLTDAMRNSVREKFSSLLHHHPEIIRVSVRLHQDQTTKTGFYYTATGQIEIGGPDFIASAEGADAYAVLSDLAEKLSRQLERRHDRLKGQRDQIDVPLAQ